MKIRTTRSEEEDRKKRQKRLWELAKFLIGVLLGSGLTIAFYQIGSPPFFLFLPLQTNTVALTTTTTETVSQTVTQTTTATVTALPPPTYGVQGTITVTFGTTPTLISFKAAGYAPLNFTISGNTYQATLLNYLQYTVTIYWHYNNDLLGRVFTSGCGTFQQTVGAGSSVLTMNWNC